MTQSHPVLSRRLINIFDYLWPPACVHLGLGEQCKSRVSFTVPMFIKVSVTQQPFPKRILSQQTKHIFHWAKPTTPHFLARKSASKNTLAEHLFCGTPPLGAPKNYLNILWHRHTRVLIRQNYCLVIYIFKYLSWEKVNHHGNGKKKVAKQFSIFVSTVYHCDRPLKRKSCVRLSESLERQNKDTS